MTDYPHGDTTQFVKNRFGMFIHWGLYSMPARHEWVRNYEEIPTEDYEKYFLRFNPDLFDPKEWARTAREAGMKYFVITTKHHEGFCMWDTKYTDYKITNTPYGKDILREIVDAFRAEGIRVGFYYSLIDWHHPDFPIDQLHPLRNKLNFEERAEYNRKCDMKRYAEYMRNQVTELLTNYGKIDILWFDFSYPASKMPQKDLDKLPKDFPPSWIGKGHEDWESEKLLSLIRSLQPDVILDDRMDLPGAGDIKTPEQYMPDRGLTDDNGNPVVWEGCQTFSGSWGYYRDEMSWKSGKQCIDLLINHVSRGGNLLMNVGPTSRGYFDARAMNCLKAYADWMKYNNRSIYGCGLAPIEFTPPTDCRYTYNAETNRLYLHLMNWPFKSITLPNLAKKVEYAQFLHDGSEVLIRDDSTNANLALNAAVPEGAIILELPVIKPPVEVPVIELFLK